MEIGVIGRGTKCKSEEYINVIDINDGYTVNNDINCEDNEDCSKTLNISTDIAGVYIKPSQNNNEYNCTMCDYKCTYVNIFKEHMMTHTKENKVDVHIDEIPSESVIGELNNGARNINDVATLECSICESKCKKQD